MTETEQNILNKLDILLEIAKSKDCHALIDALEQYDLYRESKEQSENVILPNKNQLPEKNKILKDCSVIIEPLPSAILAQYLLKYRVNAQNEKLLS